jgi:hypothetical protein
VYLSKVGAAPYRVKGQDLLAAEREGLGKIVMPRCGSIEEWSGTYIALARRLPKNAPSLEHK